MNNLNSTRRKISGGYVNMIELTNLGTSLTGSMMCAHRYQEVCRLGSITNGS